MRRKLKLSAFLPHALAADIGHFARRVLCALIAAVVFLPGTAPADDIQADFDAALEAIEQNRLRTARERLTALLGTNPSLSRARLELARVYYLTQDYADARREAQAVLDNPDTPPAVRTTVLAFLAQIDADERLNAARHQWSPNLYAGLMFDSNVNIGPSRDVIDVGGTLFSVAPGSQETEDFAVVLAPGITHTWNPGRRFEAGEQRGFFLWQSQANGYWRGYFDEDDFNLGILTLRTGPAWVVPGHWRAGVGLQADQIFLGGDDLALYTTLNPAITWEFDGNTEFTLEGVVTDRQYQENDEEGRDGLYTGGSAIVTRFFVERKLGVQLGAGWATFDADDERFSYDGPDLIAGVLWEAWPAGLVYARINYRKYDFDGLEPLFPAGPRRDDDEFRYSIGAQHVFRDGALRNWSLLAGWIHTDNRSNLALYDYDRDVIDVGLARRF